MGRTTVQTRSQVPRVSIGVPVYNGERFLGETLESLLAQSFCDFEIIICDNASTDKTPEICRNFAESDARIRYVRNSENLGLAMNYRRSFELSIGEYFRWANSDDLFAPDSLARCVGVLDSDDSIVLTYPKTKLIDEFGNIIRDYEDNLRLMSPLVAERFVQCCKNIGLVNVIYGLMRASELKKTSLIGSYISADIVLVEELSLYGKFSQIDEYLFFRRMHSGANSCLKDQKTQLLSIDPNANTKIPLTRSRHVAGRLRAISRAPLRVSEKIQLYFWVMRMGVWDRYGLFKELRQALMKFL